MITLWQRKIWAGRSVGNTSTNVFAKFRCTALHKALGIFTELITTTTTSRSQSSFLGPTFRVQKKKLCQIAKILVHVIGNRCRWERQWQQISDRKEKLCHFCAYITATPTCRPGRHFPASTPDSHCVLFTTLQSCRQRCSDVAGVLFRAEGVLKYYDLALWWRCSTPMMSNHELHASTRLQALPLPQVQFKPQTHDQQMLANIHLLANNCWQTFVSHTTTFCWTTVWRRWRTQQTTTLLQQWFV